MRVTVLHYALTASLSGMLALSAVTGGLGETGAGRDATSQVTQSIRVAQYCTPDQGSDAANAPRIYCHHGQG